MWEAIIGSPISPEQVVLCMAALKIAREAGAHEEDNVTDGIGYLTLIPELRMYDKMNQAGANQTIANSLDPRVRAAQDFKPDPHRT